MADADDDAPNFLVPRIPGMAIVAGLGLLLVLAAAGSAALRAVRGEPLFPADTDAETDTDTTRDAADSETDAPVE